MAGAWLDHDALALRDGLKRQPLHDVPCDAAGRAVDAVVAPQGVVHERVFIDECERIHRQVLKAEVRPQFRRHGLLSVTVGEVVVRLLVVFADCLEHSAGVGVGIQMAEISDRTVMENFPRQQTKDEPVKLFRFGLLPGRATIGFLPGAHGSREQAVELAAYFTLQCRDEPQVHEIQFTGMRPAPDVLRPQHFGGAPLSPHGSEEAVHRIRRDAAQRRACRCFIAANTPRHDAILLHFDAIGCAERAITLRRPTTVLEKDSDTRGVVACRLPCKRCRWNTHSRLATTEPI